MMKRTFSLLLLLLCILAPLRAAPIDTVFADLPDSLMPLLERSDRLDLLDLYNSHMRAEVGNLYGGRSRLEAKSGRYVRLSPSAASTWELVRLPAGADTLSVVLRTVRTPAASTRLSAYGSDWSPVSLPFVRPALRDFVGTADSVTADEREAVVAKLQPAHVELHWDDAAGQLVATLSTAALTADDHRTAAAFLHPLIYKWSDGAFRRQP